MASSPSHKFGQIIGEVLEDAISGSLQLVAKKHGLYLDHRHPRPARGNKKKVAWQDSKGNAHDLDFVFEEGGSEAKIGKPRAFVESVWRRYTRHSRNKCQEIQGAIIPLAETYSEFHPFLGAVLAGVFTDGSLSQLASHGFRLLHFPYESIVKAFATVGIDAAFDEDTPGTALQAKVEAYEALSEQRKQKICSKLAMIHRKDIQVFIASLEASLSRRIARVIVLPLNGSAHEVRSSKEAISFIESYDTSSSQNQFVRFELRIYYSNGDEISASFRSKQRAYEFLKIL